MVSELLSCLSSVTGPGLQVLDEAVFPDLVHGCRNLRLAAPVRCELSLFGAANSSSLLDLLPA